MAAALGLLESDMEHLDRIERKIDTIEEHSRARHARTMDELTTVRDRVASIDRAVGVLQEKGDSIQRMAYDHEGRIRSVERDRWFLHGLTAAIATLISWFLNHMPDVSGVFRGR